MTTYYIDPSAATNGAGTLESPRNTYPTAVAYGDRVLFKEGTTISGGWVLPTITGVGSDSNRLTIGTYSSLTGGAITQMSRQATIVAANNQDGIFVSGKDYVTISNLQLLGTRDFPLAGVRVLNSSYVTVEYCTTESSSSVSGGCYGVRFDNATGSGSARTNWTIRGNVVKRTTGNAGIICVWSSTAGEYVSNILVTGNTVLGNAQSVIGATNDGITIISRATALYVNREGLTAKGVVVTDNTVTGTHAYAYKVSGASAIGGKPNVFSRNRALDIGDFKTDMHCMWFAACDLFIVEDNYVNGSNAFIGQDFGSGVGIFIDKPASDLDGSSNFVVRRNICFNTGRESTSNSEVGGAGILVFLSSGHVIEANFVSGCSNGIVAIGWYGSGAKTSNVIIRSNTVVGSRYSNYYVCKSADAVSLSNNLSVGGNRGYYIENSGSAPVTNYSERNNFAFSAVEYDWCGGNEPTAALPTILIRTPAAGNATADPLLNEYHRPTADSPIIAAGAPLDTYPLLDVAGNSFYRVPTIGAFEYVRPRAERRGA